LSDKGDSSRKNPLHSNTITNFGKLLNLNVQENSNEKSKNNNAITSKMGKALKSKIL